MILVLYIYFRNILLFHEEKNVLFSLFFKQLWRQIPKRLETNWSNLYYFTTVSLGLTFQIPFYVSASKSSGWMDTTCKILRALGKCMDLILFTLPNLLISNVFLPASVQGQHSTAAEMLSTHKGNSPMPGHFPILRPPKQLKGRQSVDLCCCWV